MNQTHVRENQINLKKLEEISDKDKAFIQFICRLFINETVKTEEKFNQLIQQKKYKEIKYLLHQCKPRFNLINDLETSHLIGELETLLSSRKKNNTLHVLARKLIIRFRFSRKIIQQLVEQQAENNKTRNKQ